MGNRRLHPMAHQDTTRPVRNAVQSSANVGSLPSATSGLDDTTHECGAGDAVADAVDAAELLDVDMDQFARLLALVAGGGLARLEGR